MAATVVSIPLATTAAVAQTVELFHIEGTSSGANEGHAVAHAGDVDGDGVPDLLVGAIHDGGSGRARLCSGVDGARIHDWVGGSGDALGAAVAGLEDVDGDGGRDVFVGALSARDLAYRRTGAAYVYSGATGKRVRRYFGEFTADRFGTSLAELGDVDGDGVPDHAVGAPGASHVAASGGAVHVFSGASGAELFRIDGNVAGDELGTTVTRTGDLDGDGLADLAVGVPFSDANGVRDGGAVCAYSSASRTLLLRISGSQKRQELGRAVAGGVDLDGDGVGDFLIGTPLWIGAYFGQGTVLACSGTDGKALWRRDGVATDDGMGRAVALEDRDLDGVPELLVSAGTAGVTPFRIERLRADGIVLYQRTNPGKSDDQFGSSLAVLEDLSGDGVPDVAIGTPDGDPAGATDAGIVDVLAGERLWLNADPKQVAAGANLVTQVGDGDPGFETMRFAVELNGAPLFLAIPPLVALDGVGMASFVETIPPGLSGITTKLRAYAVQASGKLGRSNDELIAFL